ncbi:hypothetical protein [Slackia exigua]|uniref:hypothetical protein n=1 Tax=Slackia exigua TaxID=84109 RepID=UPI0023F49AF0|nr:hypothetical protein [Slackia exigua]
MSNERMEVADRLRRGGIARDAEEAYVLLLSCIGIMPQLPAKNTYEDALVRIADLVDPTCKVNEMLDNDEFLICIVSDFICRKCGHETIVERNLDGSAERPNYCSNCGARVVDGDE